MKNMTPGGPAQGLQPEVTGTAVKRLIEEYLPNNPYKRRSVLEGYENVKSLQPARSLGLKRL